jgi:hypothetical protein
MRPNDRFVSSRRRRISLKAESLEQRTLLSGSPALPHVAIDVPSAYVSQQADQLTVRLVRPAAAGQSSNLRPLTVDFSAMEGSFAAGGVKINDDTVPPQFTPVNESVTFPQGVTTETVVVPINSGAPNPGTVPVHLSVTSASRKVRRSDETVYLADSVASVPPTIIGVQRVAGGIAITFSKPMDPATVQDIHNYAVKFSPSNNFNLEDLTGFGLIQTLNTAKQPIPLRRATYNASTNTVTLVATEQLGPNGSYMISNPVSLLSKAIKRGKAHPLTDLQGNPLEEEEGGGVFSITISKGDPYAAAMPVLSDGS